MKSTEKGIYLEFVEKEKYFWSHTAAFVKTWICLPLDMDNSNFHQNHLFRLDLNTI